MSSDLIAVYGTQTNLSGLANTLQSEFNAPDNLYWTEGNKHFFSSPELEVIVSQDDLYTIFNHFDSDEIAQSQISIYQQRGGYQLPEYKIEQEYSQFQNGDWLQSTTYRTYLEYEVLENGQAVLQYNRPGREKLEEQLYRNDQTNTSFGSFKKTERLTPAVSLFPNPAINEINLALNDFWSVPEVTIKLFNSQHQFVHNYIKEAKTKTLKIKVNELPAGIYFLHFAQAENQFIKKVVITK